MRRLFWRVHSILGLTAGLGLIVIGLSGSALVFHEELDAVFNREQTRVVPTSAGRLPLDELLARVEAQLPGYAITGWQPQRDNPRAADGAYVIAFGEHTWNYLTVDPYRGTVLSGPRLHEETLKGWMLELHYTFFADHVGMAVSGLLGVALCLLGVSGLWIYRRFWRTLFTLRWRSGARLLFGDIHRFTGVTSVGFNLLLGFTGAYWNIDHVLHELREPTLPPSEEFNVPGKLYPEDFRLDAMVADAAERIPGFVTHYVSLPWSPGGGVTLWGKTADAAWFRNAYGSQVSYDAGTGAFGSVHDIRNDGLWAQTLDAFEPLHFGNFGGLPIKVLWALAGLAPGVLAVSGMAIWWQRRRGRQTSSRRPRRRLRPFESVL